MKSVSEAPGAFNRHSDAQVGLKKLQRAGSWFIISSLNEALRTEESTGVKGKVLIDRRDGASKKESLLQCL